MSSAATRRAASSSKLASPVAADIIAMFAKRNPKTRRAEIEAVGKLVAAFGAAAVEVSPARLRRMGALGAPWRKFVKKMLDVEPEEKPLRLTPAASAETSRGSGLGEILSAREGRARLEAAAVPVTAEAWAGRLAGPTELAREYGVARSTLHSWAKQGAVIAVQVGVRKHAFPVEQFIDGRPVAGLAPLVQAIGDTRTAWHWLREPNPAFSGATPLSRLKAGAIEAVLEMARSNFGQV
jgi:hypothetical protein